MKGTRGKAPVLGVGVAALVLAGAFLVAVARNRDTVRVAYELWRFRNSPELSERFILGPGKTTSAQGGPPPEKPPLLQEAFDRYAATRAGMQTILGVLFKTTEASTESRSFDAESLTLGLGAEEIDGFFHVLVAIQTETRAGIRRSEVVELALDYWPTSAPFERLAGERITLAEHPDFVLQVLPVRKAIEEWGITAWDQGTTDDLDFVCFAKRRNQE